MSPVSVRRSCATSTRRPTDWRKYSTARSEMMSALAWKPYGVSRTHRARLGPPEAVEHLAVDLDHRRRGLAGAHDRQQAGRHRPEGTRDITGAGQATRASSSAEPACRWRSRRGYTRRRDRHRSDPRTSPRRAGSPPRAPTTSQPGGRFRFPGRSIRHEAHRSASPHQEPSRWRASRSCSACPAGASSRCTTRSRLADPPHPRAPRAGRRPHGRGLRPRHRPPRRGHGDQRPGGHQHRHAAVRRLHGLDPDGRHHRPGAAPRPSAPTPSRSATPSASPGRSPSTTSWSPTAAGHPAGRPRGVPHRHHRPPGPGAGRHPQGHRRPHEPALGRWSGTGPTDSTCPATSRTPRAIPR